MVDKILSETRKLCQLLHDNKCSETRININDNRATNILGPVPVDAHPPTVAIKLDRVRGQFAGDSVAAVVTAGENMTLGFSLLQDGDDILARVSNRHLSVHSCRGEAPAYNRYGDREGDLRRTSRLASHGGRWRSCICWRRRGGAAASTACEGLGIRSWDRMSSMGLGRGHRWLVLSPDWIRWCALLVGVVNSREEEELSVV